MKKHLLVAGIALASIYLPACNNQPATEETKKQMDTTANTQSAPAIKEEAVSYTADGLTMNSFVAYQEGNSNKRPAVLVIPEWWGLNDYAKGRAKQLAALGYIAMAVDFYGNGKNSRQPRQRW